MFISTLLIGIFVILVIGDDSSTSTSALTYYSYATYTAYAPTNTPTYDLNDTVTFQWNATGFNWGAYFCHSTAPAASLPITTSWITPSLGESEISPAINPRQAGI